eukprot:1154561-Pelagomonas_calceolata.AAC.2
MPKETPNRSSDLWNQQLDQRARPLALPNSFCRSPEALILKDAGIGVHHNQVGVAPGLQFSEVAAAEQNGVCTCTCVCVCACVCAGKSFSAFLCARWILVNTCAINQHAYELACIPLFGPQSRSTYACASLPGSSSAHSRSPVVEVQPVRGPGGPALQAGAVLGVLGLIHTCTPTGSMTATIQWDRISPSATDAHTACAQCSSTVAW